MASSQHIKLGYLREPESHEMFFPYTHVEAIIGLNTKLSDILHPVTINLDGVERTVLAPADWATPLTEVALNKLQGPTSGNLTGYLKRVSTTVDSETVYSWVLDPYGGSSLDSVNQSGASMASGSTVTAGLKTTTSTGSTYQKISFAAITNDTATGNDAVTIIINGNF